MHRIIHTGPIRALTPMGSPHLATHHASQRRLGCTSRPNIAWRINTASRKPESHWMVDSDKPPSSRAWRRTYPNH